MATSSHDIFGRLLFLMIGLVTWLGINSLWVELPIFMALPEAYQLPAYLVIIIQVANVGPIIFSLCRNCVQKSLMLSFERWSFCIIFAILLTSTIVLIFVWSETVWLAGQHRSIGLIVTTFFIALGNCSTNVIFLPYLGYFLMNFTTAFFVGQALSGLIPSIFSFIQGVGEYHCVNVTNSSNQSYPVFSEPKFSVSIFYAIMSCITVLCFVCYCIVEFKRFSGLRKDEYKQGDRQCVDVSSDKNDDDAKHVSLIDETTLALKPKSTPRTAYVVVLLMNALLNGLGNSFLPQIQTYASLPYGKGIYNLAVRLSVAASPLACLIAFVRIPKRLSANVILVLLICACSLYLAVAAAMSPAPPFVNSTAGGIVMVCVWVTVMGLIGYTKLCLANLVQLLGGDAQQALFWLGASSQAGSLITSIVGFVLVNILSVFNDAPFC